MIRVNVVDQICGSGKTSAAINYMNGVNKVDETSVNKVDETSVNKVDETSVNKVDEVNGYMNGVNSQRPVIYVTTYLDEIVRIKNSCKNRKFYEPVQWNSTGRKMDDLLRLLQNGENIVTTHSLFGRMNNECVSEIANHGYILFMDEVAEVCKAHDLKEDDIKVLMDEKNGFVKVGEHGVLTWTKPDYRGDKFALEKNLCNLSALAYVNNKMLTWLFPAGIFESFSEVWILTYMFESQLQRCYYDMYGIEYVYKWVEGDSIENYHFVNERPKDYKENEPYRELIRIVDNPKLNYIGGFTTLNDPKSDSSLSVTWYEKNGSSFEILQKNIYNFFHNVSKTEAKFNLWTCFNKYRSRLNGKGYTKGFLACNARATNAYRNKTAVAYMINRYFNPVLSKYFEDQGIEVDNDGFALSELIQFIFRSTLRDGNSIDLYIPSLRMRTLLIEWLNK